jgi:dipeptidyl aminopeptidase/acylaminoacyl peptidase
MRNCTIGRSAGILAIALLVAGAAHAAASAYTLEQVRHYAYPEGLVAANAAPVVAWTSEDEGRRNLWVAEGRPLAARQLTHYDQDDGQELTGLSFSNDGRRLVYVRGGEHGGNWENSRPVNVLSSPAGTKVEVWTVDVAGGAPRRIDDGDYASISPDGSRVVYQKGEEPWIASLEGSPEPHRLFTVRGATSSLTWSPDGRSIAFVSGRGSHALIGVYTGESAPIRWIAPSTSNDEAPLWSPDGRSIAFVRRPGTGGRPASLLRFVPLVNSPPGGWELWVGDVASGTAKRWVASAPEVEGRDEGPTVLWGAGGRLVVKSYVDGWPSLYSVDANGRRVALTKGGFHVEDVAVTPDRRTVLYSANTGADPKDLDRRHLYAVPVDAASPAVVTAGTGLEWTPVGLSDGRIAFLAATAQRPPVPAHVEKVGAPTQPVGGVTRHADFPESALAAPEPVTFRSSDGFLVHGQLFRARGKAGRHPGVVYVHGGPPRQMLLGWHYMGYYSNDYAENQYLASRGITVLSVNYRLGIGYGQSYQFPAAAGPAGASEYLDVVAGAHYLQSLADVDPERIGIYGGSYGGYLTALALARDSDLFKVGVDIHGVHDWVRDVDYPKLARERYEGADDLKLATDTAWRASPSSDVSRWRSPVLFIHGDDDRNVDINQLVDLVERLRPTGVHQEQLVLVDETHSIFRHANELRMNAAVAEFLERWLRP